MTSSFLFSRLFEAKKNKAAQSLSKQIPSSDGPQLFAEKLASQVFQTKRMGNVSIPSWSATSKNDEGVTMPGSIIKYIHPSVNQFLSSVIPDNLKDSSDVIKTIFLHYLDSLVAQKTTDVKADIKKLKSPSLVGKNDDDMDVILTELAGTRFKVPAKNPILISILKQIGMTVASELDKQQVTHDVAKNNIRLREFSAALQSAITDQSSQLQFFSLARKIRPDYNGTGIKFVDAKTQEQSDMLDTKLRFGNRAMVAYTTLLFPFMNPASVSKILKGTGNFFPVTGERYQGVLLNNAAFSPDTDFTTLSQITDPTVKKAIADARQKLKADPEFATKIKEVENLLITAVRRDSILSPRIQKRIAKSMYYSAVSALSPAVLNFAEIDNTKFMPSFTVNMLSADKEFLSTRAQTALNAAVKQAEENPAILQGLHGRNARQQMNIDFFLNKKAAGLFAKKGGMTDANIEAALALVLQDPKIEQINSILLKWLDSANPTESSSVFVDEIKALVNKYKNELISAYRDTYKKENKGQESELSDEELLATELPKYDTALFMIDSLLGYLKEAKIEDFEAIKVVQQQLIDFFSYAHNSPVIKTEEKDQDTWESLSPAEKNLEFKLMFEKFNDYIQDVTKKDPIRGEAIQSILNLSNLRASLDRAVGQLAAFQKSDKLIAKTASRKRTLSAKIMAAVTRVLGTIDMTHLFSSSSVLDRIEKEVVRYAKLVNPRDITEPISVGASQITSTSTPEDIKTALMSLISSNLPTEKIVSLLKEIKINSSYNNSVSMIMSSIIDQIESPSIVLGNPISPIKITPNSSIKQLSKQIRDYIQTESTDLSSKLVSDLLKLPSKVTPSTEGEETIEQKRLSDDVNHMNKVLSAYSPSALSLARAVRSDTVRSDRRKDAVDNIRVMKNAGQTLSTILLSLFQAIKAAPEHIQFMLKNMNVDNEELHSYFEEELRNILLDPEIKAEALFKVDRMTLDLAFSSAAQDLVNQVNKGTIYKDSDIIQVDPFVSVIPKPVGVLINLAASLKEYNGVTLKNGYLSFDLDFDPISSKYGILTILDTLDREYSISARLTTSVIAKLCIQRYFFNSVADIFDIFAPTISAETFIQADLIPDFTNLGKEIDAFVSSIKSGSSVLHKIASDLDEHILKNYGGVIVPILTKDANGNIVPLQGKSLTIPSSKDTNFGNVIRAIALNAIAEIHGGSTKAGTLKTMLESLNNKEQSLQAFTEALQLIQSLIVVELGKKYADVDGLVKNAVNFISSSLPEDEEVIVNGVNTIRHLAGSLDTALHTKHVLKGTNQIIQVINPLISSILDLFSFDMTGADASGEPESKELIAFEREIKGGKLNRRNAAELHSKEGSGTFKGLHKSFLQIADQLGIAYKEIVESKTVVTRSAPVEVTEGVEDDILKQRLAAINAVNKEEQEPEFVTGPQPKVLVPGPQSESEQTFLKELGEMLGVSLPTAGFYIADPKHPAKVFRIDKTKAKVFQSVAKRLYGGYVGPTVKGGQQYQRFANVKSFVEYLDATRKVTREVLDIFNAIYRDESFIDEANSLEKENSYLLSNLMTLRKMFATLSEIVDGESVMLTVEGQNKFFTLMKDIVEIPVESITRDVTKEVKGKSVTKSVVYKVLDPIQKIVSFPLSESSLESELDAIGPYLGGDSENKGLLEALRPIAEKRLTWKELQVAFNNLSDQNRYIAATGKYHIIPAGGEVAIPADKVPTKRQHEFLATFMSEVVTVLNFLKSARKSDLLTEYDFSSNPLLLSVYATLFSSATINQLPNAVKAEMKKKSEELLSLLTRDEQIKIEQAIKNNPQPAVLLNKINAARKAEMNNPENAEMLAQLQAEHNPLAINNTVEVTDNPFRLPAANLQVNKVSKDINENISLALSILSEAVINNIAEETAMEIYGIVYKHNKGNNPPIERGEGFKASPATMMPQLDFMNDVLVEVKSHLWLLPLMFSSSYSKIKQFTTLFNRKEQFQFVTNTNETIEVIISDFTKLADVTKYFKPLEQSEPNVE